jgi:hypothetical protein
VSDAPSIADTLTYPILTNETSPHFAEALTGSRHGLGGSYQRVNRRSGMNHISATAT